MSMGLTRAKLSMRQGETGHFMVFCEAHQALTGQEETKWPVLPQ